MKRLTTLILILLNTMVGWTQNSKIVAQSKGSITFVVDENLPETGRKTNLNKGNKLAQFMLSEDESIPKDSQHIIYSSFADDEFMLMGKDAFFRCVVKAYAEHRPLVLSPDMVWMLITQGFARYVNAHPEDLRDQLVSHTGKIDLVVQSDKDLLSEDADWEQLMDGFTAQIGQHTKGDIAKTITANFSTTEATERIASEITLMETVKSYFEYIVMRIACGIPTVTLTGTPKDWQKVLDKTQRLKQYGLGEWTDSLTPILTEFVEAAKGHPNQRFWQSIVKQTRPDKLEGGACSNKKPTKLDGWLLKLFPDENGQTLDQIAHTKSMPSERVRVNFKYQTVSPVNGAIIQETPMELMAGFVGAEVDTLTHAITPKMGWLVRMTESSDDILTQWKKMDQEGSIMGIHIRVKEVPEMLAQLKHIRQLHLVFTDKIVLPDWMDNLTIDQLIIADERKLTESEKDSIRQRFPQVQFLWW